MLYFTFEKLSWMSLNKLAQRWNIPPYPDRSFIGQGNDLNRHRLVRCRIVCTTKQYWDPYRQAKVFMARQGLLVVAGLVKGFSTKERGRGLRNACQILDEASQGGDYGGRHSCFGSHQTLMNSPPEWVQQAAIHMCGPGK